jgi:hypothetical protein
VCTSRGALFAHSVSPAPFAEIETTVLSRLEADARPRRQRQLCGYIAERHRLTGWEVLRGPRRELQRRDHPRAEGRPPVLLVVSFGVRPDDFLVNPMLGMNCGEALLNRP